MGDSVGLYPWETRGGNNGTGFLEFASDTVIAILRYECNETVGTTQPRVIINTPSPAVLNAQQVGRVIWNGLTSG